METDEPNRGLLFIGEVARLTGFPTRTLRYYEEIGLVEPASRTDAGYRLYGEPELARLEFVRLAKHIGLKLEEIKELLDLVGEELYERRLEEIVEARVVEIERQIVQLSEFRTTFRKHPFPYVHEEGP